MKISKYIAGIIIVAVVAIAGYMLLGPGADKAPEEATLRIGVILPMTGGSAYIGESIKKGMEIARQVYEEQTRPKPFKLDVEYVDSSGSASRVVTAYHNLVDIKGVQAIIAVQQGVKALIPMAARDKRVLLATSVPDNGITGQNHWTFRFFINAESDSSTIADYAYRKLGLRRAALIYVNDSMGTSYRDSFSHHFTKLGGKIVAEESFNPTDTTFRTQVLKIKEAHPDAVYIIGYGTSMANIPIQLREADVNATLLAVGTISQPEIMKAAGAAANGIYYTTSEFSTFAPKTPELKDFVNKYRARFGNVPVFFEVFGYDSLRLLLHVARLGGVTPEQMRHELFRVKDLPMAVGKVTVDPNGDVRFPVVVKRIVGGKWVTAP